jgi:hypothetical protein
MVIAVIAASGVSEINPMAACKSSVPSLLQATIASDLVASKRIIFGATRAKPNSPKYLRTESIKADPNCSPESVRLEITLTKTYRFVISGHRAFGATILTPSSTYALDRRSALRWTIDSGFSDTPRRLCSLDNPIAFPRAETCMGLLTFSGDVDPLDKTTLVLCSRDMDASLANLE